MTTCDLCHQTTINYRVDPETRVFVDLALRDLVVCLACDPQLPEATQKQRKRAEVAETEVLRLRAAEDLLRQSHMTTVRERDELRGQAVDAQERGGVIEALENALLGICRKYASVRLEAACDAVANLVAERTRLHAEIQALKEKK
jgi:hypothetical protein